MQDGISRLTHANGRRRVVPVVLSILSLLAGGAVLAQTPPPDDPARRIGLPAPELGVAIGLPVDSPAVEASTAFRPRSLEASRERAGSRFYRGMLLPRLEGQINELAPYRGVPQAQTQLDDSVLFDEMTDAASYRAERATRKAVKAWALEVTSLGRTVTRLRGEGSGNDGVRDPVAFGVSVSHGLPEVHARYDVLRAVVRLALRADGSVGMSLDHGTEARTRLWLGYDRDRRSYDLLCRISF